MIVATVVAGVLLAQTDKPWYDPSQAMCYISLANAPVGAPRFEDYPAVAHPLKPRVGVQMTTRLARTFRTVLRDAARQEPNFASGFIVAEWGCGASCTTWAVVDPSNGRVLTAKDYAVVVGVHVNDDNRVQYRRGSRLIVVEGSADDEKNSHDGLTYLVFNGRTFRKIAFYSTREYCVPMYYGPH